MPCVGSITELLTLQCSRHNEQGRQRFHGNEEICLNIFHAEVDTVC